MPAGHLQGERDRVAAFVVELRGPRATEFEAARDGHAIAWLVAHAKLLGDETFFLFHQSRLQTRERH